jgi:hypothetical protein
MGAQKTIIDDIFEIRLIFKPGREMADLSKQQYFNLKYVLFYKIQSHNKANICGMV